MSHNKEAMKGAEKIDDNYKKEFAKERQQLDEIKHDVRNSHFKFGDELTKYLSTAKSMGSHNVTSDDVVARLTHMKQRKEQMRRANFKMPYHNLTTHSTYQQEISDLVELTKLNEGRPNIMSELKNATLKTGSKLDSKDYTSEFKSQFVYKAPH